MHLSAGARRLGLAGAVVLVLVVGFAVRQALHERQYLTLPIGRFPVAEIPRTAGHDDVRAGYAAGFTPEGRGWLIAWRACPSRPDTRLMADAVELTYPWFDHAGLGEFVVKWPDRDLGLAPGDGHVVRSPTRVRLQGPRTMEGLHATWWCPEGKRVVTAYLWEPRMEDTLRRMTRFGADERCHQGGAEVSTVLPAARVSAPAGFRVSRETLTAVWLQSHDGQLIRLSRGELRGVEPALTLKDAQGVEDLYAPWGSTWPEGRAVAGGAHPGFELTGAAGTYTDEPRDWAARVWICPEHGRLYLVQWFGRPGWGSHNYDKSFLRTARCPEGCAAAGP